MKFEKVSFKEFKRHTSANMHCGADEYDQIILPVRSTSGSAGYDIACPVNITIPGGCSRTIPTGLKVQIEEEWCMLLFVRSSAAIKKGLELQTGVSVIDSDYFDNPDNEGHIFIGVRNTSTRPILITAGERIAQGVFVIYGKTVDDMAAGQRSGGIGSTT